VAAVAGRSQSIPPPFSPLLSAVRDRQPQDLNSRSRRARHRSHRELGGTPESRPRGGSQPPLAARHAGSGRKVRRTVLAALRVCSGRLRGAASWRQHGHAAARRSCMHEHLRSFPVSLARELAAPPNPGCPGSLRLCRGEQAALTPEDLLAPATPEDAQTYYSQVRAAAPQRSPGRLGADACGCHS